MARDLPDDLEHDHISNYEVSDDYAEKYLMRVADARTAAEKRIAALEARVAALEADPRMALTARDLEWAAKAGYDIPRKLRFEAALAVEREKTT